MCHFVLVFFSPFSIAITSLGEERANLSAFRTFVRFVLVWICWFPLPLGVWEGLRFVIVALPGLFSYHFLPCILSLCPFSIAITSLGEARACLCAFRAFICFARVGLCLFPLGVRDWLRLKTVASLNFSGFFFIFLKVGVTLQSVL